MHTQNVNTAAVYPRSRGEHGSVTTGTNITIGLSRLTQGTRAFFCSAGNSLRFIPAAAGNTNRQRTYARSSVVYPPLMWGNGDSIVRAWVGAGLSLPERGTRSYSVPVLVRLCSLSPLAPGKQGWMICTEPASRLIPAAAGNTHLPGLIPDSDSVYPRWRGEHYLIDAMQSGQPGLSPLMRGTYGMAGFIRR